MATTIWVHIFQWFAGLGFFLTVLLLRGVVKGRLRSRLMAMLIFLFALSLTYFTQIWSANRLGTLHLTGVWVVASYLFGPLLYLYIRYERKAFALRDLWHLLPASLMILLWLPFPFLSTQSKIEALQNRQLFYSSFELFNHLRWLGTGFVMVAHQTVYAVLFWRGSTADNDAPTAAVSLILHRQLAILFSLFVIAQFLYYFLSSLGMMQDVWDYLISLLMCICIYLIGISAYRHPRMFEIWPLRRGYLQAPLTTEQSARLAKKVTAHLEQHESYLNSQLRLPILAEELNLSVHQLSQIINEQFNCSFPTWLNTYRLQHAHRLLLETELPVKAVAYQSGFHNLTTFYQIFKETHRLTPTAYRKAHTKTAS